MMYSRIRRADVGLLLVLFSATVSKAVEPALIFSDRMVLQRDVSAPVWGRADPGEEVTITFAGQNKHATADSAGLWRARLDAMPGIVGSKLEKVPGHEETLRLATVVVSTVPILLVYPFLQKHFVKGVLIGAVRG